VLATVFLFNLLGRGSGDTYAVFLLPLEREFGWARSQLTSVYWRRHSSSHPRSATSGSSTCSSA
jgi:hypothetical protein